MSLPRYHHVEMPMPAPNEPSIVFSCQKQPASLSTTLVNVEDPTASSTSMTVQSRPSPLWKPLPGDACGFCVSGGCSHAPQPATSAATPLSSEAQKVCARSSAMVTGP